jgi:hypothetical protein
MLSYMLCSAGANCENLLINGNASSGKHLKKICLFAAKTLKKMKISQLLKKKSLRGTFEM